jgi:hypothetical protein
MKNLFKSKNKESNSNNSKQIITTTDENGFMTRPILSSSASYGPGSDQYNNYPSTRGNV